MEKFRKGDRVKLTDKAAAITARRSRRKSVDWIGRRGTVLSSGLAVSVRWDDRASPDWWPIKALELAE